MQIRLKQDDIEQAVKDYLIRQGVTRVVEDIVFTMGRKDTGLSADIECGEQKLPSTNGFTNRGFDSPLTTEPVYGTNPIKHIDAEEHVVEEEFETTTTEPPFGEVVAVTVATKPGGLFTQ